MKNHSKRFYNKLSTVLSGWEKFAPESRFGELSLEQFKEAVASSVHSREQMADCRLRLKGLIALRGSADVVNLAVVQRVVAGVLAHPEYGRNSGMYRALGYIPHNERASGLKRDVQDQEDPGLE